MLSVICPVYNEKKYIAQFLSSILQQDFPKNDLEIILVDGMSNDGTREIIADMMSRYPFINMIDNPQRIVPFAMNYGIGVAKGDIIMRLDAHASYSSNYFSTLVNGLKRLKADNVGSVCKTDVLHKTLKALAIREVLSHPLGVGNSTFRIGTDREQEVDTVPFGCWPKTTFEKFGMFDERLARNQDLEYNKRIIRGGGHIYILPQTCCTYYARETYKALAKNNYSNGYWNILTVYLTKTLSSLSWRHFVPLLFLLSLILPLLFGIIWWPLALVAPLSFLSYLLVLSIVCFHISSQKQIHFGYLLASFVVLHLSYGWGSLRGIIRTCFGK